MSSTVYWIKLSTRLFENEKIKLILSMPKGDSLVLYWIRLLCLAGAQNNRGMFCVNGKPYTNRMFATVFGRSLRETEHAISLFYEYGMLETVDGIPAIADWEEHQSSDRLELLRQRDRERKRQMKKRRKRETAEESNGGIGSTGDIESIGCMEQSMETSMEQSMETSMDFHHPEKEREKDTEKEKDYNDFCMDACARTQTTETGMDGTASEARINTEGIPDTEVAAKQKERNGPGSTEAEKVDKPLSEVHTLECGDGRILEYIPYAGPEQDEELRRITACEREERERIEALVKDSYQRDLEQIGGGGKGVVWLSQSQVESLLEQISIDEYERYIARLADFILRKKATVHNHYKTILKWVEEDRTL